MTKRAIISRHLLDFRMPGGYRFITKIALNPANPKWFSVSIECTLEKGGVSYHLIDSIYFIDEDHLDDLQLMHLIMQTKNEATLQEQNNGISRQSPQAQAGSPPVPLSGGGPSPQAAASGGGSSSPCPQCGGSKGVGETYCGRCKAALTQMGILQAGAQCKVCGAPLPAPGTCNGCKVAAMKGGGNGWQPGGGPGMIGGPLNGSNLSNYSSIPYRSPAYPPSKEEPTIPTSSFLLGEILAYRGWREKGGGLQSWSMGTVWLPHTVIEGKVGSEEHGGGVYAFKSMFLLEKFYREEHSGGGLMALSSSAEPLYYGEVLLWGDVMEHELGYRAQFAKIRRVVGVWPPERRWHKDLREPSMLQILQEAYNEAD